MLKQTNLKFKMQNATNCFVFLKLLLYYDRTLNDMNKFKRFDIVSVVTNPRQEEPNNATILALTEFEGEEAAVIQYHYNSCAEQIVQTKYMMKVI